MEITYAIATTLHLGLRGEYNQTHPNVRITHDHFIAGAYYNSERRVSVYAGFRFEPGRTDQDRGPYVELGAVTGYTGADVVPYGRIGFDLDENIGVFVAPAYEYPNTLGAVIGVELKF